MRNIYPLPIVGTLLVCTYFISPANAAARDRVFVASFGSDSNPCTFLSPCKTFQQAVNVVAAAGEVTAIDSAGFGPVTITQSVTITSPPGVEAGIAAAPGGTAISIVAPNATVVLRGLTLLGANAAAAGINFSDGSRIEVIDCTIREFQGEGIVIQPSTAASALISNTVITDIRPGSGGVGVQLVTNGSGAITAALDHVTVSNTFSGIQPVAVHAPLEVLITDSHVDNNGNNGIEAQGSGSFSPVNLIVKNVTLNQEQIGIALVSFSTVWLSQVTQTSVSGFNTTTAIAFDETNDNFAFSDGTNHLMGVIGGGTLQSWALN